LRLLLAEDNAINQKLAVVLLQKAGYSVDAVEDGASAVKKVKAEHYNAVLMDVQMPEMDGFEATRQIRAWETQLNRHIPIIAMTAHAMAGDRERCLAAGMDDYVAKPLEPKLLFSVIDRWTPGADLLGASAQGANETEDYAAIPVEGALDASALHDDFGLFGEEPQPGETDTVETVGEAIALPQDRPAIDLDAASFRFGGDRRFMLSLCREFTAGLPERLSDIRASVDANDASTLGRLAHNLKGVALNFNADELGSIARQLEEAGKREDLSDAPALLTRLEEAIGTAREFVAQQT